MEALAESRAAWRALPPEARERFNKEAKGLRALSSASSESPLDAALAQAAQAPADFGEGPWFLCARSGPWPLSRHCLVEACQGESPLSQLAAEWAQDAASSRK